MIVPCAVQLRRLTSHSIFYRVDIVLRKYLREATIGTDNILNHGRIAYFTVRQPTHKTRVCSQSIVQPGPSPVVLRVCNCPLALYRDANATCILVLLQLRTTLHEWVVSNSPVSTDCVFLPTVSLQSPHIRACASPQAESFCQSGLCCPTDVLDTVTCVGGETSYCDWYCWSSSRL